MASTGATVAPRNSMFRWVLVATILVALPLANALIGFPYLRANIPGNDGAWLVHREALIAAHVVLVVLVALWARSTGFDLRARPYLLVGAGVISTCLVIASVAASQRQLTALTEVQDSAAFSRWAQAVSIASILWAGVGQEVLFRAFALPVVADAAGSTAIAVLVTSAAFAFYHGGLSLGVGNLLANFAAGVVLGVVFVRTENLWSVAVPHALLITVLLAVT